MARRRPTLPIAFVSGDPTLTISDVDWERIESAYERILPLELREQIHQRTYSYLLDVQGQQGAESDFSAVVGRIDLIKRETAKYRRAVFKPTLAASHADELINAALKDAKIAAEDDGLGFLFTLILPSIETACDKILKDLRNPKSPRRTGAPWDRWIVAVARLLDGQRLPIDASHDERSPLSPFVRFIGELQKCIPPEYREYTHSPMGLAAAISRARLKGRKA